MTQRRTDNSLFYSIVVLMFFGVVMIFSASSALVMPKLEMTHFLKMQLLWILIGLPVLLFFKRLDFLQLNKAKWAFGAIGLVVMLQVLAIVLDGRNHRWIRIGPIGIQPSELAKPALILFLAFFVTWKEKIINSGRYGIAPALMVLGLLFVSIGWGDLGTSIVLAITAGVVFLVAGLQWRAVGIAFSLLLVASIAFVCQPGKNYRVGRLVGWIDPDYTILNVIDPNDYVKKYVREASVAGDFSYQARQAKIAVGSGGVFGVGLMQSAQKLEFLPEAQTDCIYAIVGEELGLWGTTGVLFGFLTILWRGIRLAFVSRDQFGRFLALGITVCIIVQAFVNMTMVLGLIPTKGIPLPLISYGGSSLLSSLICLGMLLSVSEQSA